MEIFVFAKTVKKFGKGGRGLKNAVVGKGKGAHMVKAFNHNQFIQGYAPNSVSGFYGESGAFFGGGKPLKGAEQLVVKILAADGFQKIAAGVNREGVESVFGGNGKEENLPAAAATTYGFGKANSRHFGHNHVKYIQIEAAAIDMQKKLVG